MAKRKKIPEPIRNKLLVDAMHRCCLCPEHHDLTDLHHIIPISEGGPDTEENLMAVCPTCHGKIHRIRNKYTPEQLKMYKDRWVQLCALGLPLDTRLAQALDYTKPPPKPDLRHAALHQLRPPRADFTGREAELAELRANIDKGVTISGLHGMGGIGKTELALKLADELKDQYPDAQFYLDLKGTDAKPLMAAEAMAHVIRGFEPELRLPEDQTQLTAVYRSTLHGQRVLLLMDNAADAGQVEPLIPHDGCLLLVTSRQHFVLPGLFAKSLDTLPADDAYKLVLTIAERIGQHASQIARLCGYLPLALRVSASTIAERRDLTPAEYVERFQDERKRLKQLGPVEASISLSEALLPDELRHRWHALAVFPGDFDRPAAAAVWELADEPAHDTLSTLVTCSLVEFNDNTARYHLHDLARLVADKRLAEPARTTAQRRHAEHHLTVLRRTSELYLKGGSNVLAGLALFDQEWANTRAGFDWARSHAQQDKRAARLCCDYPDAGAHLLDLRQHPREQITWFEAALAAARQLGDSSREGNHLGSLGIAYAVLGEPRRAIERYEQQLTIAREIGDRRGEGNALGCLGIAYADLGDARRAIGYYEQHLAIARKIGDRRGEGAHLGSLGLAYAALGEPRRAIEYHEQALVIAREIGDRRGEANASWNMAGEYAKLGDLARAVELSQVLVDYEREIGHADAEKHAARVQALRDRLAEEQPPTTP